MFELNPTIILTILFGILTIGAVFVGYYLAIKNKIRNAAETAINMAEELDKIGAEKLEDATERVYALVPMVLRPLLTKSMTRDIIQYVFDEMEAYALKQKK